VQSAESLPCVVDTSKPVDRKNSDVAKVNAANRSGSQQSQPSSKQSECRVSSVDENQEPSYVHAVWSGFWKLWSSLSL